jgi:hypothetical protein
VTSALRLATARAVALLTSSTPPEACASASLEENFVLGFGPTRGLDTRGLDTRGLDTRGPDTRRLDTRRLDTRRLDTRRLDTRGLDTRQLDTPAR